jgi:endonuclease YncB( thermonuclease family)
MRKNKIILNLGIVALLGASLSGCGNQTTSSSSSSTVTDVDVVANTHLKLDADVFSSVMARKSAAAYDSTKSDFNRDGVERMLTTYDYAPNASSVVFTNYVDGDTTQFTSYNGNYTVKVRYLAIDTPESTSEIEEWGKAASLFNKGILTQAKYVIIQSATSAKTGKTGSADLDGYQRSLAYVWYSNDSDPTQDSFRNLNLELVYNGYSVFSGEKSDMDSDFYDSFMQASDIATAKKLHIHTDQKESDTHYYYGDPKALGLDQLYDTTYYTNSSSDLKYSMYCDEYTRWTFEGVVSRKVGNAFYIQDKINGKYYGLYVFTLRNYAPVVIGNRIKVSGVLSFYGGAYELSGVSYSFFNHSTGDIEYVDDASGNHITETVTPVEVTASQMASGDYPCVLVKLKGTGTDNNLYFNTYETTYKNETTSNAFGGSEEINQYNTAYPFYNTDNKIVVFGKLGSDTGNITSSDSDDIIRVVIPSDNILTDENSKAVVSYKYFTGTLDKNGKEAYHYYVPKNAQLAYDLANGTKKLSDLDDATKATVTQNTFTRKKVDNVIGVAQNYMSSSGKTIKYSLNVCSAKDDFDNFEKVE